MAAIVEPLTRIAIIDDDARGRKVTGEQVQDMGALPVLFESPFENKTASDVAAEIVAKTDAAICDHRLRRGGYALFDGAELVAQLTERGFPAVLLTVFVDMDADSSIRRWRHKVPVLLDRDEADESAFGSAIDYCRREIAGDPHPSRRSRRTFVRVLETRTEDGEPVVDAIVPDWNSQKAVRFPLSLVPESLRTQIAENALLTAMVNIGASGSNALFFEDFQLAPEPDEEDGLG